MARARFRREDGRGTERPTWRNSEVIGAYRPEEIRRLKDRVDGDIYTSGSITLVQAMLADGLVDGLHLFVYPVTLGKGTRLLSEEVAPARFDLATSDAYANGVVYLNYRPSHV